MEEHDCSPPATSAQQPQLFASPPLASATSMRPVAPLDLAVAGGGGALPSPPPPTPSVPKQASSTHDTSAQLAHLVQHVKRQRVELLVAHATNSLAVVSTSEELTSYEREAAERDREEAECGHASPPRKSRRSSSSSPTHAYAVAEQDGARQRDADVSIVEGERHEAPAWEGAERPPG